MGDLERGGNMLQIFSLTLLVNNTERKKGWVINIKVLRTVHIQK